MHRISFSDGFWLPTWPMKKLGKLVICWHCASLDQPRGTKLCVALQLAETLPAVGPWLECKVNAEMRTIQQCQTLRCPTENNRLSNDKLLLCTEFSGLPLQHGLHQWIHVDVDRGVVHWILLQMCKNTTKTIGIF